MWGQVNGMLKCALVAAFGILSITNSSAQTFPNKPVRIMVPYPAGAPVDNFARGLGETLGAIWKQPVIIDNRPGANEIIAAQAVTKSPADGYTLLLGSEAAFTQNAFLYSKMPYDADKDLAPVTRAVYFNMVLITRSALGTPTLKDFVSLMKKEGNKHSYGSAGAGGTTHLAMESIKKEAGFDMLHVPYKGIAPAMQDMLGNSIDAMIAGATAAISQMPTGKVKVLAIAGTKRAKSLPDVPTFAEAGYPKVVANLYLGLAAPAGTPKPVVDKIAADIRKALADKAFLEKNVEPYGYETIGDTPEQFLAYMKQDKEVSGRRIKELGIKLD
ncbi:Bug family tripartite tricarboxylate transporter substrate binding protein [Ottowia thiooxydans]|uniref:Bug family tripartite tricarboxylate transporter substrate binding protein n=1 Tax=Ottowia thiooxydans TaxID=219182 RepID=UPI0003FAF916|nr:tripartite tricarboxylate transporter substrate binding protein [Ottowia thiooxydans]